MAAEFGLGITPWSPLKSGALTGKYRRDDDGSTKSQRGAFLEHLFADPNWREKAFAVVDELERAAKRHDTTIARAALAWVRQQSGVSSTIIGARTIKQLEDNIGSLDVTLTADELTSLDALSKPTFGFPQSMQPLFPSIQHGGMSVNGVYAETSPFVMEKGETPY